jgi:hypothetical protein
LGCTEVFHEMECRPSPGPHTRATGLSVALQS